MIAFAALVFAQASLTYYDFAELKIALPVEPTVIHSQTAPKGTRNWGVHMADGTAIMVSVIDVAGQESADRMLSEVADGVRRGAKAVLTEQRDLLLDGWPGLAANWFTPRGPIWGRGFAFPKSIVFLTIGGGKTSAPDVDALIASAKVDAKVGPGASRRPGPTWGRVPIESPYSVEFPAVPEARNPKTLPGAALRGWASKYGNRSYAVYTTVLDDATPSILTEQLSETAKLTNDQAVQAANATLVRRRASTLFGYPTDTVEATLPDGETSLIFQTMVTPRGSLMLAAVVPHCLKESPEVSHFLSSIRSGK